MKNKMPRTGRNIKMENNNKSDMCYNKLNYFNIPTVLISY